jgi:hypothetical protein
MILSITILYIGLSLLDIYYDFDWKEFTSLVLTIPLLGMAICILSGSLLFLVWLLFFLIEYKSILK